MWGLRASAPHAMNNHLAFGGYDFSFSVITTENFYEPDEFAITEVANTVTARVDRLWYGEWSGSVAASLQIKFARVPGGITWQAQATHPELIKGIKVSVASLPNAEILIPLNCGFHLADGEHLRICFPYQTHPKHHRWKAQFVAFRTADQTLWLDNREHPFRVKRLWLTRHGEQLALETYNEDHARSHLHEFETPAWTLKQVPSWANAVEEYRVWMENAYQLVPLEKRVDASAWLNDIALTVTMLGEGMVGHVGYTFAQMEERLEELAHVFPPQNTLLYIPGYDGRMDMCWPNIYPSENLGGATAFRQLVTHAHRLGFKVLLHLSVWAMDRSSEFYKQFQDDLVFDNEGRPQEFETDRDGDGLPERVFAYISPDCAAFRQLLLKRVRVLVEEFEIDAIHFDQTHSYRNDPYHDHYRGLQALYREMRTAFPHVLFGGESITEITAPLLPLAQTRTGVMQVDDAEAFQKLFAPYTRRYGHPGILAPEPARNPWSYPAWTFEAFQHQLKMQEAAGAIPTLCLTDRHIRLDSSAAQLVLAYARRFLKSLHAS
jgi:hypothetical protein